MTGKAHRWIALLRGFQSRLTFWNDRSTAFPIQAFFRRGAAGLAALPASDWSWFQLPSRLIFHGSIGPGDRPQKRLGKPADGLSEAGSLQCVSVGYDTARIGDYVKTVPRAMPKRRSKFSRNRVIARRQPDDDEIDLIQTGTAGRLGKRGPKMNSYINLIFDAEGAKERLQRLFQTAPEQSAEDFFDSRHRSGANRANKHSASSQADSSPGSQVGTLVSAEIGFSVWARLPKLPVPFVFCVSRTARLKFF